MILFASALFDTYTHKKKIMSSLKTCVHLKSCCSDEVLN